MPYKIGKDGVSVEKEDGTLIKKHGTHAEALAHLRALEANVSDAKSLSSKQMMEMGAMGGAEYAVQEAWDISNAAMALAQVAALVQGEEDEPGDVRSLAAIMRGLLEFIDGEIKEMEKASRRGEEYEKSTRITNVLDLSYVKGLHIEIPDNKLAVKYVGKNTIAHPVFIWGNPNKTDLDIEYFTRSSDFWDTSLKDFIRPLTWDHGQDERFNKFEPNPVIGKTVKYYDDDVARWAESIIETDKKYRKFIDQFIEEKRLGYSSDSAPQYIIREKQGKATWLKMWPWFGGSLTVSPCEPRMKEFTPEFLKSLGVILPDATDLRARYEHKKRQAEYLNLKIR